MRCAACAAAKVAKLFLKGDRCYKPSCPIEKRGTQPPGQHGNSMRRGKALAGYGQQLREKQKVKAHLLHSRRTIQKLLLNGRVSSKA